MRLPIWLISRLQRWAERRMKRYADLYIGGRDNPYLIRWWVLPRNHFFNVYLHRVLRSDDDRALHDHPWINLSILLKGSYVEHTIVAGGINRRIVRNAGAMKARLATAAHRLEIAEGGECWTIFMTGPRWREWGFHCPISGWKHWRAFTEGPAGELVGRGCAEG